MNGAIPRGRHPAQRRSRRGHGGAPGILDDAALTRVRVVVSGGLDEFAIAAMQAAGAPVDLFAVGTKVETGADARTWTAYRPVRGVDGMGPGHRAAQRPRPKRLSRERKRARKRERKAAGQNDPPAQ